MNGTEPEHPVLALDEPVPMPARTKVLLYVAVIAPLLLFTVAVYYAMPPAPPSWGVQPSVVTSQLASIAVVSLLTAVPLVAYARSSGRLGFMVLSGTFFFLFALRAFTPFVSYGGVVSDAQLLGTEQSGFYAYTIATWVTQIGLIVSAAIICTDVRRKVPPRNMKLGTWVMGGVVITALLLTAEFLSFNTQFAPVLVEGPTRTQLATNGVYLSIMVCAVAAGWLAWTNWHRGSMITWWLFIAVTFVGFQSVVVLRRVFNLYAYYANVALSVVSVSVLLLALLWSFGRVGSNQIVREREERKRVQLHLDLADGIEAQEFLVHYQPIVESATKKTVGAEALLRWRHNGAMVSAGEFIDFAEKNGQVTRLGEQARNAIIEDLPAILAVAPPDFFITYNLSVTELEDQRTMDDMLFGSLAQEAGRIVLEVTETINLDKSSYALSNLGRLVTHGYALAIDDFGTGYSNLTRINRLQPKIVKLDRSVVQEDGMLLEAAVHMISQMLADALAEGVETLAQHNEVVRLGVKYAQGWYYVGALSPDDLMARLAAEQAADPQ